MMDVEALLEELTLDLISCKDLLFIGWWSRVSARTQKLTTPPGVSITTFRIAWHASPRPYFCNHLALIVCFEHNLSIWMLWLSKFVAYAQSHRRVSGSNENFKKRRKRQWFWKAVKSKDWCRQYYQKPTLTIIIWHIQRNQRNLTVIQWRSFFNWTMR